MTRVVAALALLAACALGPGGVRAQPLGIVGPRVQEHANAVLALMSFSAVPDLTSSSLSIDDPGRANPGIVMSQLGGGFTVSKRVPLYLEGAIAYSRYDPVFVASDGRESRQLPVRWNSVSGTAGVGWDFPITPELAFRPIFNFSLGKVASDLQIARAYFAHVTDRQIDFLDGGSLNAYGLGGGVMLDWEHYRDDYEVDLELRYSDIELRSFGGSSAAVEGRASARTANVWARWRAPTGLQAFERPLRYVLEFSHSHYLGSQADVLGFDRLTTLGTGLEVDTSGRDIFITRVRAVLRYVFGNNVSGVSLGLAVSF
ncbi:hypothetical protein QTH87_16605 [Variovorax sp. J22P168]|uniref:hypothetical protein n=1 Tax=Variovorax jilinensis TaxID=3053513 RepID=UPI0025787A9A|nr:hypothetical protein [Variovorax sp. J22P168]MDM0014059.1 hypothetical protein [Variovorax sp. J22P168]